MFFPCPVPKRLTWEVINRAKAKQWYSIKPGIVELRCDVHAEMAAYILVMENPYFAVTDKNGNFEIPDNRYLQQAGTGRPGRSCPGNYAVKTWHEKLKTQKSTVVVPESGDVTVELKLKRGTPGVLYK